jgi:hypothetical protein
MASLPQRPLEDRQLCGLQIRHPRLGIGPSTARMISPHA